MMATKFMSVAVNNDAELVSSTLSGNREAFGQIVSRYQSLICSLTYSATGSLGQSEDLAQETFVTAWKQLAGLREPEKLRAWLCGIARNRINNFLRREGREPVREATPLEEVSESHSPEPLPLEYTISREERAILWRSLEGIPEIYREPLILFYRENQSIEAVAEKLDLNEDAVKQRLSRGRKLLHKQVLAFVEGALERTGPQKTFTLGVIGALPLMATTTKAATSAATATKSTSASSAVAAGFMGVSLGFFLMFLGYVIRYRAEIEDTRSDEERHAINRFYRRLVFGVLVFFTATSSIVFQELSHNEHSFRLMKSLLCGAAIAHALASVVLSLRMLHHHFHLLAEPANPPRQPIWEYCSRRKLFGVPLVHIRIGSQNITPIRAWFAVGQVAYGRLFAFGSLAVAPLSCGWIAIGLLPFGTCAFGLLTLGGFSLGIWAFGAVAVGWEAFGACAIAWFGASGWIALAGHFAGGDIAVGPEVNNDAVRHMIHASFFLKNAWFILRYLACLTLLWLVPTYYFWRLQRSHNQNIKLNP